VTQGHSRDKDGKVVPIKPQIALRHLGPTVQVIITPTKQFIDVLTKDEKSHPKPVAGVALIDTGASLSAVDEAVCKSLGLTPTG
jgi:hypothetical protein